MFFIKELSLCILLTWLFLVFIEKNDGGVVNRNLPVELEQVHRISQQMNAIRNQVQKDAIVWSRLAEIADQFETAESNDIYEDDPEVRPRLFQGDIAIDLGMYKNWRVGLNWNAFPERMWPNRTVPYVISPLYEPDDQVRDDS